MKTWVSTDDFAQLSGICGQRARKIALQFMDNARIPWRGAGLVVRKTHGRGGKSGLSYEIRVDSLPVDLQLRLKSLSIQHGPDVVHGAEAQRECDWWLHLLSPALAHAKGSAERAEAVRAIVSKSHFSPSGDTITLSERTIQRRLSGYQDGGIRGLSRKKRSDTGTKLTIVSRVWDEACGLPEAVQLNIRDQLITYIRQLHREGMHRGGIDQRARLKLFELSRKAASIIDQENCVVTRPMIDRERSFSKVYTFERDRKKHEDNKPRILRTPAGIMPMDVVFGDVHHLDFDLAELEGMQATAKAVAWYDYVTDRVHMTAFRLPKGEAIRNEHVIEAFKMMVAAWGMPKQLYLDNGGEFNFTDFFEDAHKLARWGMHVDYKKSAVTRAKPYNAAAKPIEGVFNILTNHVFPSLPGWRGGKLGAKKTPNINRKAVPFMGTFDQFAEMLGNALALEHHRPRTAGRFKGKSPNSLLDEAVKAGWTRTAIDEDLFIFAFSCEETRVIRKGRVSIDGREWTGDVLAGLLDEKVIVLIPKYSNPSALIVKRLSGELLGVIRPAEAFHPLDPAGAKEAARLDAIYRKSRRDAGKSLPRLDIPTDNARVLASLPPAPEPPIGDRISASDQLREITDMLYQRPSWLTGMRPLPHADGLDCFG